MQKRYVFNVVVRHTDLEFVFYFIIALLDRIKHFQIIRQAKSHMEKPDINVGIKEILTTCSPVANGNKIQSCKWTYQQIICRSFIHVTVLYSI